MRVYVYDYIHVYADLHVKYICQKITQARIHIHTHTHTDQHELRQNQVSAADINLDIYTHTYIHTQGRSRFPPKTNGATSRYNEG